ncbi:MAG: toprim domain-containing protein [Bacteroidaceae bacterium]|nr:toprim domain-containing protein [Bacteroidaceae bacterium]
MTISLLSLGIQGLTPQKEKVYVACPFCKDKHEKHSKKRCLKVNVKNGYYKCFRCEANGRLEGFDNSFVDYKAETEQKPKFNKPVWDARFINVPSETLDYLVNDRKLSLDTLKTLKVSEPWTKMPESDKSEQVIAFNYFLNGELTNIKYRSIDKRFKSFTGGRVIPYNLDSVKDKTVCAITEGEIDALTLYECGFKGVLSVPTGGNANVHWIADFWETHFKDKAYFILALDNDKVGHQLRDNIVRHLGADKCCVVQWHKDCKDANEELLKHGKTGVISRIERAVHPLMENVYTANELEQDLLDVYNNRIQHGLKIGLKSFDDLVSFETGRLVIMSGRPGDGKSELVDEIAVRLNLIHGWKVAYFSPENVPIALHLRKLSEKITGYRFEPSKGMTQDMYNAVKQWLSKNIFHILPKEDRYELDSILDTARMLVERKGVKMLVIDPFNRIEQRLSEGQTELQYISSMLNRLVRFTQQTNVMVMLVAHPRKVNRNTNDGKSRRVEMNDINGSADFGNKADICLIVDRDDEKGVTTVFVDKVRFKHLGKRGFSYLHYDPINGRFNPCEISKAMNHNGEVIERYANVQWQAEPWILPDGTLLMPGYEERVIEPIEPPTPTQQTLPFAEA